MEMGSAARFVPGPVALGTGGFRSRGERPGICSFCSFYQLPGGVRALKRASEEDGSSEGVEEDGAI